MKCMGTNLSHKAFIIIWNAHKANRLLEIFAEPSCCL